MKSRIQKSPAELLNTIAKSDELLREKAKNPMAKVALSSVAMRLADKIGENNKGYETDESRQMRLIGILPDWIRNERYLDDNRQSMSRQEKIDTLGPIIQFNHILREMIDTEQYTTMPEIVQFIQQALLHMRESREVIQYAVSSARSTLNGMRHEIAAESVLSMLPKVEGIRGATAEEELEGKDIIVEYTGRALALDIKASQRGEQEALAKSWNSDTLPVWSGFTNDDFGNQLTLRREHLMAKSAYYQNILSHAVSQQRVALYA